MENINYEKLLIYHCKNNHANSLDVIKFTSQIYTDIDTILIIASMYNNYSTVEWLLTDKIFNDNTIEKLFRKMCSINNKEIVDLIVKTNYFKYHYEIIDNKMIGIINLMCKVTDLSYNDVCCVCLDDTECKTNCNHELCKKCICTIYGSTKKCPICRQKIEFCYVNK